MIPMVIDNDPLLIFSINFIDYILNKVNAMAKKREYWPSGSSLWTKIRDYADALKECFWTCVCIAKTKL
jgi:hypothetical protein